MKPTWVLLAGLPAAGKSSLAHALSSQLDRTAVLDKDRVRDALFPGTLTDYTSKQDDLCLRAMMDAAGYMTDHGLSDFIFFDGRTFSRSSQIDEVVAAAEKAGAGWRILHLTCSDEVADARLRDPLKDHPARNRDIALYYRVKAAFEPILRPKLDLDTSAGIEAILPKTIVYLRYQ